MVPKASLPPYALISPSATASHVRRVAQTDPSQAVQLGLLGIQQHPESAIVQTSLGAAYMLQGDLSAARERFLRFRLDATDKVALHHLARVDQQLGRRDFSKWFRLIQELDKNDVFALHSQGRAAAKTGKFAVAEDLFNRILSLQPTNPAAMLGLADIARRKGDGPSAERWVSECMRAHPQDTWAWTMGSALALDRGDFEAAQHRIDEVFAIGNDDGAAFRAHALIPWRRGDLPETRRRMKEAVKVHPRDRPLRMELGTLLLGCRDYGGAVKQFRQALTLNLTDPRTQFGLGFACFLRDLTAASARPAPFDEAKRLLQNVQHSTRLIRAADFLVALVPFAKANVLPHFTEVANVVQHHHDPNALRLLKPFCNRDRAAEFYLSIVSGGLKAGVIQRDEAQGLLPPSAKHPLSPSDRAMLETAWAIRAFVSHPEYVGVPLTPSAE